MSLAAKATPSSLRQLLPTVEPSALEPLRPKALPLGLRAVDEALPEGGLPRGAVVELAAPFGLARATSIALAACAAAQAEAKLRLGDQTAEAWCAFLDPTRTLFAPAVARAGVDLERLLVVQPPPEELARTAVRVASSGAFAMVIVDLAGVPGNRGAQQLDRWVNAVRRLSLAIEGMETTVLLLTDAHAPRAMPLPVALRLEVDRPAEDRILLRIAKDRRGRVAPAVSIHLPFASGTAEQPAELGSPRRESA